MIQGAPDSPGEVRPGSNGVFDHMTEKNTERGEKRGVLATGRAKQLGKTKDADAESDRADDDEEG